MVASQGSGDLVSSGSPGSVQRLDVRDRRQGFDCSVLASERFPPRSLGFPAGSGFPFSKIVPIPLVLGIAQVEG